MNIQNISFDHVEAPRPWSSELPRNPPRTPHDSESTLHLQHQDSQETRRNFSSSSLSPQPTVIPARPSPPSQSISTPELYGPQRHHIFTRPLSNLGRHVLKPAQIPIVRFDEAQLAMMATENATKMAGIKDELALAAGKVTPGVDDTPYIQYALEALTRDRESPIPEDYPSPQSADAFMNHIVRSKTVKDAERGSAAVPPPQAAYLDAQHFQASEKRFAGAAALTQSRSLPSSLSTPAAANWDQRLPSANHWVAVTDDVRQSLDPRERTYPPLTYKPRILRPFSMMILMTLCLMMMAALIYCIKASEQRQGLTPYAGSLYSGQYFLFRILPQLLGSVIFLYAQSIVNTSLRVLPFVALADEDPRGRYLALFERLYPTTLFSPQWQGPWQFMAFDIATWATMFTIPLQSAAFTCVLASESWKWAPVQGVVWALVAIYCVLVLSTAILMVFWFGKWTGLLWDIRSIADLLPLLNRSNALGSFDQRHLTDDSDGFKMQLRDRWFDRLGYWRTGDLINGGTWYTIGAVGARGEDPSPTALRSQARASQDRPSFESEDLKASMAMRGSYGRYLPWCLRSGPIIGGSVLISMIVLAILLVSFLPQTRIEEGFRPLLTAKPTIDAFSAANFLYSFIPSLIGMILFILFQSLDLALRIVQPWGELSQLDGSPAHKSILADYAACLPFQSAVRAAQNGHWRLALVSAMAQLFVFLPVLAGGLLIALTNGPGDVRMFASIPVLGVLVALLVLYAGCLGLLIPKRAQFDMPRPATSIAALMSLCSARDLVHDAAFRAIRSRTDLEGRLGVNRGDPREESVWFYGVVPGRDEHRVSVRRMQRYTEKRIVRSATAMV